MPAFNPLTFMIVIIGTILCFGIGVVVGISQRKMKATDDKPKPSPLAGVVCGVSIREPNGSVSSLEARLQNELITEGAEIVPLIQKNVTKLTKEGITNLPLSYSNLSYLVCGIVREGPEYERYSFDFKIFNEGKIVSAGFVSDKLYGKAEIFGRFARITTDRLKNVVTNKGTVTESI